MEEEKEPPFSAWNGEWGGDDLHKVHSFSGGGSVCGGESVFLSLCDSGSTEPGRYYDGTTDLPCSCEGRAARLRERRGGRGGED